MVELAFSEIDADASNDIENINRHLGPADPEKDASAGNFAAQIHDAPIPISLKSILDKAAKAPDNDLYQRYDLWLVPHRFSIFKKDGSGQVSSIGCEVEYLDSEGGARSIVSIFPNAEFVTSKPLAVEASSKAFGLLDQLGVSALVGMPAADLFQGSAKIDLPGCDLDLRLGKDSTLSISLEVATPVVLATGVGSKKCMFQFNQAKGPLEGRDHETWAIVAAHKRTRALTYRMRLFYTIRTYFIPRRWETEWVSISGECTKIK
jgi:hypothetical protein